MTDMNEAKVDCAMVLAAGLGTRLRPLTDTTPKPLVSVGGQRLIDYSFDLIRGAQIQKVVVNCHHLADQIRAYVGTIKDLNITLSDETDALLETGGGVLKALPLLGGKPFAVLNSDVIVRDGAHRSLEKLIRFWDPDRMDIALLMQTTISAVGGHDHGDYHMDSGGKLTRRDERVVAPFLFTGVQIIKPHLFDGMKEEAFSLNRLYDQAEKKGRLYGLVHEGQWLHVGTEVAIKKAEQKIQGQ
ncbi:nucleotidyltransferase family protein [Sneathiella aquimaris]|uniref:nucleotidyltransferase family protein n=1 Tax=Sneathiella aquimaris TaxID=2599305 RepID=UPI00146BCCC9|nr:nucleotidyltransferase family protein [Sneathiella aquimaris]